MFEVPVFETYDELYRFIVQVNERGAGDKIRHTRTFEAEIFGVHLWTLADSEMEAAKKVGKYLQRRLRIEQHRELDS